MKKKKRIEREFINPFLRCPLSDTEKEVYKQIEAQQIKGRERYKVAMSHLQSTDPVDWAIEAIEEAVDMLQYLVSMKMCLQKIKVKKEKIYESHVD